MLVFFMNSFFEFVVVLRLFILIFLLWVRLLGYVVGVIGTVFGLFGGWLEIGRIII